jgi:glycosyltransferase involved in cell wall biosynthesis
MDDTALKKPTLDKKKLRVVHAPTNRAAKGSDRIIAMMEKVKEKYGGEVEFQLVEQLPHKEAIRIFRHADLLIDQILIGWYGGVAIEAMGMGKPVICRIADEDLHFLPSKMAEDIKEAFIVANPESLDEVVIKCIEDRKFLKRKSEAGLEYARTWHDPKYVASITKEAYEKP